jgi:hypothetical protein
MSDRISTGGPYFLPASQKQPCKMCGHPYDIHRYMYSFGNQDRSRCTHETVRASGGVMQCECGKAYEIKYVPLPENCTEQQAEAIIEQMARAHDEELAASVRRITGRA